MTDPDNRRRLTDVFTTFLKLGLSSFGGPVAHLGFFRDELVTRRRWLDDRSYGDLVALCQFLPGPTSSQVGFALGMLRAGWPGAFAAFAGFTLPSVVLMLLFAAGAGHLDGAGWQGALHGLKIVAVAIVAQAVWGMTKSLCPDRARITIAVASVALLAALPGTVGMTGAIGCGALAGLVLGRGRGDVRAVPLPCPVTPRLGIAALIGFVALLAVLPIAAGWSPWLALIDGFYRAGALVFGGGHVVLPLLETETVRTGWVTQDDFLAGYGVAQAIPGPLFTFAAYLGAVRLPQPDGVTGAFLGLGAIFLPGFLLVLAALPFWNRLRGMAGAQSAMQGANAAVVGILGAALYDPVFVSAIGRPRDLALALICFVALTVWAVRPWAVVAMAAAVGAALAPMG